ncbi:hypothetical protein KD147_07210 [Pseudoalteromonas sp. BDTF-M6]|uniref:hypothetical protein n=2 Tax=Pseudoalteromonas TaxID=53246 RepID=UPI000CF6486B|nr:hypothetical protein [Pseudoalteromonas sp. T1lg48]MBS3797534.1 hypothetical protein [Pseudoalteromonas sp. BDTF-M6]
MRAKSMLKKASVALTVAAGLSLATSANAMKLKKQNLEELTSASQNIIAGEVIKVTDGFDNKRPYTEVTIAVNSDAKGKLKDDSTYTFRQFGLLKPRSMGNGKVYLGVTPDGFAKWNEGENVIAFMYKPASITGFQTTAGMAQGKFVVRDGKVVNQFANTGLFEDMDTSKFSDEERNMLTNPGAVKVDVFMNLIGKLAGGQQ